MLKQSLIRAVAVSKLNKRWRMPAAVKIAVVLMGVRAKMHAVIASAPAASIKPKKVAVRCVTVDAVTGS